MHTFACCPSLNAHPYMFVPAACHWMHTFACCLSPDAHIFACCLSLLLLRMICKNTFVCTISHSHLRENAFPHTVFSATMKCVFGKSEPSWDIRITCKSKATKHQVYLNVMDQLVILRRDGVITNAALVTERTFWLKEKVWEGEWVYDKELQRKEWVGSEEPRETNNPTDHCMGIFAIATTEREPVNPGQLWPRKMQQVKI